MGKRTGGGAQKRGQVQSVRFVTPLDDVNIAGRSRRRCVECLNVGERRDESLRWPIPSAQAAASQEVQFHGLSQVPARMALESIKCVDVFVGQPVEHTVDGGARYADERGHGAPPGNAVPGEGEGKAVQPCEAGHFMAGAAVMHLVGKHIGTIREVDVSQHSDAGVAGVVRSPATATTSL